jgi:hypothetical protein
MPPDTLALSPRLLSWSHWRPLERLALLLWLGLATVTCVRVVIAPRPHNIYPTYANAGRNWQAGVDLYSAHKFQKGLDLYRYSPSVAVLMVPLSYVPDRLGSVLWRFLNFGVFMGGFAWWYRRVGPGGSALTRVQQAFLWLLLWPLAVSSLDNGQANSLVVGLMLIAVAGSAEQRWNLAAACITLACLLKLYPIAIGLLLVLVYPRQLTPRLLVGLILGFALPFVCQHYDYVIREYSNWLALLHTDDRRFLPLGTGYRDLWLLFRLAEIPITTTAYLFIQLGLAVGVAALCLAGRLAGCNARHLLTVLTGQGLCWMILCGPATEWCTYILLAPVLAWTVVAGWGRAGESGKLPARIMVSSLVGLFLAPLVMSHILARNNLVLLALLPLAALVLQIYLTVSQLPGLFRADRPQPSPEVAPPLAA